MGFGVRLWPLDQALDAFLLRTSRSHKMNRNIRRFKRFSNREKTLTMYITTFFFSVLFICSITNNIPRVISSAEVSNDGSSNTENGRPLSKQPWLHYRLIETIPHDRNAFT